MRRTDSELYEWIKNISRPFVSRQLHLILVVKLDILLTSRPQRAFES